MDNYLVYLLISDNNKRCYIGCTNNIIKRLRQHNGEIVGGAKATHSHRPWKIVCTISGLDKITALCLEWRLKHRKAINSDKLVSFSGINNKIKNIYDVLNLDRFTKKCDLTSNLNLTVNWYIKEYMLESLDFPENIKEVFLN